MLRVARLGCLVALAARAATVVHRAPLAAPGHDQPAAPGPDRTLQAECPIVVDIEGTMHTCDEASASWGLDCVWLEVARGLDCRGCDCAVDGVQSGSMWSMEIFEDETCTTARSLWRGDGVGDVLVAEDIGGAIFQDGQPAVFANDVCSDLFDWNGRQVSVRGRCSNGGVWAQWFDGAGCDADASSSTRRTPDTPSAARSPTRRVSRPSGSSRVSMSVTSASGTRTPFPYAALP